MEWIRSQTASVVITRSINAASQRSAAAAPALPPTPAAAARFADASRRSHIDSPLCPPACAFPARIPAFAICQSRFKRCAASIACCRQLPAAVVHAAISIIAVGWHRHAFGSIRPPSLFIHQHSSIIVFWPGPWPSGLTSDIGLSSLSNHLTPWSSSPPRPSAFHHRSGHRH